MFLQGKEGNIWKLECNPPQTPTQLKVRPAAYNQELSTLPFFNEGVKVEICHRIRICRLSIRNLEFKYLKKHGVGWWIFFPTEHLNSSTSEAVSFHISKSNHMPFYMEFTFKQEYLFSPVAGTIR